MFMFTVYIKMIKISFIYLLSERLYSVKFECSRSRVTKAAVRNFSATFMQQPSTIIQRDHRCDNKKQQLTQSQSEGGKMC